jgi:hypothetical protein
MRLERVRDATPLRGHQAHVRDGLHAKRQALLHDWLFYLCHRATTPWPKDATDNEAKAARLVRNSFQPHVQFLEWLLGIVASIESARQPRKGFAAPMRHALHDARSSDI